MSTNTAIMEVSDQTVEVIYKNIKNLHLSVHPPVGRVRVAAPLRLTDEAVRRAVISRLGWIKRQQRRIADQERQSQREMVTGESHYFLGRRYRLKVVEGTKNRVDQRRPGVIELTVRPDADRDSREHTLREWYRDQLRGMLPDLIEKWEPAIGVSVANVGIKRMRTRWGTCNPTARRVWLNLELAKKKSECLEYVLVHEMVHLHERRHDEAFIALMDQHLPSWRSRRDLLNKAPLAFEDWRY